MGFQYESPFQGVHFSCHVGFRVYLFVRVFVSAVPWLVVDTGLKNHGWFTLSCDKIGVCNNHLLAQQAFFHALFRGEGGFLSRSSHGLWSKHRWLRTFTTQWKDITWWRGWRGRGWCEKQQRCIESQSRRTIELKGAHGSIPGRWGRWNCMKL